MPSMERLSCYVLFALLLAVFQVDATSMSSRNPVRKAMAMLTALQKKVTVDGETNDRTYDKFACYLEKGINEMKTSIADCLVKIPQLEATSGQKDAEKIGLKESIKTAREEYEAAIESLKDATALSDKRQADFANEERELTVNIEKVKEAAELIAKAGEVTEEQPSSVYLQETGGQGDDAAGNSTQSGDSTSNDTQSGDSTSNDTQSGEAGTEGSGDTTESGSKANGNAVNGGVAVGGAEGVTADGSTEGGSGEGGSTDAGTAGDAVAAMKASLAQTDVSFLQVSQATTISSFLQSKLASDVRRFAMNMDLADGDRSVLMNFLDNADEDGDGPQSGQVVGILKQMADTFKETLEQATKDEDTAISEFRKLELTKGSEIDALKLSIDQKVQRSGEVGFDLASTNGDLGDTKRRMEKDGVMLADLERQYKEKKDAHDKELESRQKELKAISEAMELLSSDQAFNTLNRVDQLGLLQGPTSFLQVQVTQRDILDRARSAIDEVRHHKHDYHLDLLALTMRGKKVDLTSVIRMIKKMGELLKAEKKKDEEKKVFCKKEIGDGDRSEVRLTRKLRNLQKNTQNAKEELSQLAGEITALQSGLAELKEDMAEAEKMRTEESDAFKSASADTQQGIEILNTVADRLKKFYQHKSFLQTGTQAAEQLFEGSQVKQHGHKPARDEANAVIGLLHQIIFTIKDQMAELKYDEKISVRDYTEFLTTATDKRDADSKALERKIANQVDMQAKLTRDTKEMRITNKEILSNAESLKDLHDECDWLLKNFRKRNNARLSEIDALDKAHSVLVDAAFGFLQIRQTHNHVSAQRRSKFIAK